MIGLFGQRSKAGGVVDGRLTACPVSPNSVSSVAPASDKTHFIEPVRFSGFAGDAWRRLCDAVATQSRVRIVERRDTYLHAEFRTAVLRFVDDVEFLLDTAQQVIHIRSASRLGRSDFGVNRRRIEAIRWQVETSTSSPDC
jgi:uncharacterized protein (DUF1499 family)